MADIFAKNKRSQIMRTIKGKDTKPELIVRSLIHKMGFRFRLHRKDLPGNPDLVFPKYKKVVFINGCFWHGHERCKRATLPKTNYKFWKNKISGNIARDKRNYKKLISIGWKYMIIWQCQIIKYNSDKLRIKIQDFLSEERY